MKVAVIGAGMAGLCTARELLREGADQVEVVVFERTNRIGGTWVYDPRVESDPLGLDPNREVVHSSMFQNLRTNLPRQVMGFLDYPFLVKQDGDQRSFPGHQEVLRFLLDYARDFGLVDLIRFGHEVIRVEPLTEEGKNNIWAVEWRRSCGEESDTDVEVFDAVVICNGRYTTPMPAEFPGMNSWPGMQIHSHNYRVPETFKDLIVVVIGNGPSAFEIVRDVATVAKEVHQAIRSPGLFDKAHDNGTTVYKHSKIKCAHEDGKLEFEDGSSIYADAIIHCTGFKLHFPFLRTNGIVQIEDNRVGPLYQHVFPPKLAPGLSFVALPTMASVTVKELQCKWIAKVLTGKVALPTEDEMMTWVRELYQKLEDNGWPKCHTHKLPNQFEHEKWLADQVGLGPLKKWRAELFTTMLAAALPLHGIEFREAMDIDQWIKQA